MAEAKNSELEGKVSALEASHGKLVRAQLGDKTFCFRKPKRSEITHYNKVARNQPDLAVEHAIGLCLTCFVGPGTLEEFNVAADEYPLAFAGTNEFQGVSDFLIKLATGDATILVK